MDALKNWMIIRFTHPTKMDVLPKTVLLIIIAAKWSVRHSSLVPQLAATTCAFSCIFTLLLYLRSSAINYCCQAINQQVQCANANIKVSEYYVLCP